MFTVRLRTDYVEGEQRIGPIENVTITGSELKLPGHEAATYRDGRWQLEGWDFLSLDVDVASQIQLQGDESPSMLYGPFDAVRVIGGLVHVSRPDRQPFARFDPKTGLWRIYSDLSAWPRLVITSAAE